MFFLSTDWLLTFFTIMIFYALFWTFFKHVTVLPFLIENPYFNILFISCKNSQNTSIKLVLLMLTFVFERKYLKIFTFTFSIKNQKITS